MRAAALLTVALGAGCQLISGAGDYTFTSGAGGTSAGTATGAGVGGGGGVVTVQPLAVDWVFELDDGVQAIDPRGAAADATTGAFFGSFDDELLLDGVTQSSPGLTSQAYAILVDATQSPTPRTFETAPISARFEAQAMATQGNATVVAGWLDGDATELAGVPLPAGGTGPSLVVVPIIDGQVSGVWLAAGMGTSIDVRDIEITSDAIYVAGGFLGSIAFGTGTVTAAAKDGFVVRFERQGFEAAPGNAAETYAVQLTGSGDDEVRAVVEHQAQLFTAGIYGTDLVWKLGASSDTIFSVNDLGRAFVLPLNKASGAPAPAAKLGFVADAVDANSLVASGEHVYAAGDFAGGEMSFLTNPGGGEVPNIRGAGTRTLWLVDFSTTAGTNVDQTRSFGSGKHQLKGLGLRNELPLMVATCDGPFTVIDAMGVATTIDDGLTEAQAPSGEDLCLVGLSPSLEVASDGFHRLGGEDPESQVADGVGSHASGALVVTGHYRGDLVFSQQTLSNGDGYDKGFAFRLAP